MNFMLNKQLVKVKHTIAKPLSLLYLFDKSVKDNINLFAKVPAIHFFHELQF